jgi:hypothetical protein
MKNARPERQPYIRMILAGEAEVGNVGEQPAEE